MQALKRQHLTRETVRRHLQKQAGSTVLSSGVRLPDTVPAFSGGIRQAALGRSSHVAQAAWLRLKAVLARTIRRAAGSLMALLGAGGVVLLLAMVIGAAAAVIGSPMGICLPMNPVTRTASALPESLRKLMPTSARQSTTLCVGAPGMQRNHDGIRLRGRSHLGELLA